jgi:hypothetical protein
MGISRLTCAAPHPDREGQSCGSLLAFGDGFEVLGTARGAIEPAEHSEGTVWLRCHRSSCGCWTQFKIPVRNAAAA